MHFSGGGKFRSLDGIRGIAAIAVAMGHLSIVFDIRALVSNTALAVDLFFMLSGFVLAHAYLDKLNAGNWLVPYLLARMIRLYPLIILGAILGALGQALNGFESSYLLRLALQGAILWPELRQNGIDPSFLPLNPPSWSLLFEIFGSLLFGVGLWRGRRLFVVVAVTTLLLIFVIRSSGTFDVGWSYRTMMPGFVRVMFGMGAGILLYRLRRDRGMRTPPVHIAVLIAALALVFSGIFESAKFQLSVAIFLFPIMILSAAETADHWIRFNKISGDLSYPLYILHWPVFVFMKWAHVHYGQGISEAAVALLSLLAALLTSFLVLRFYDEPLRKWITRKIRRDQPVSLEQFGAP